MKRLVIMMVLWVFPVSSAIAVTVETKGEFNVRGSYISNHDGTSNADTAGYGYYDSELDMTVIFRISNYTNISINFEIRDQDWLESGLDDSKYTGTIQGNETDGYTFTGEDYDDGIEFKRLFGTHIFPTSTIVSAGLMTSGAFGTTFGDTADGYWRVSVTQKTGIGFVGAILAKQYEEGARHPQEKDAEKDDGDIYYLFGDLTFGNHKVMPLFTYYDFSHLPREELRDRGEDGLRVTAFTLALSGVFGPLAYEAEAAYADYDQDWDFPGITEGKKYGLYGAYLNMWSMIGATKVGGQVAYGSWDNEAGSGYGFGEDYTPTMFGADWTAIGTSAKGLSEYSAVTLANIYSEFTLSEPLSLFANGTYWFSNSDEGTTGIDGNDKWKDAAGYEIDLGGTYKISENVTYDVLAAFGRINFDKDAAGYDDADAFYRLFHRFTIQF